MASTMKIKRSAVPGKVPSTSDLQLGELAVNTYDGKLYTLKDNGTQSVVEVTGGGTGSVSLSSITDWPTAVSATEVGYLDGVTSAIQTQLGNKQPLDADLTAIAALAGSSGVLKKTAADTWVLDTNTGFGLTISATAPSNPSVKDLWFNSEDDSLAIYYNDGDSSQWVTVSGSGGSGGGATVSTTAPTNPSVNDEWLNPETGKRYVYYYDGDTYQWVEFSTQVITAYQSTNIDGGLPSTNFGGIASFDAGGI